MKHKIITIMIAGLSITSPSYAHGLFRPAFNKTLVRIAAIKPGQLQRHLTEQRHKKVVFVDLKKIYWGDYEQFREGNEEGGEDEDIVEELKQGIADYARQFNLRVRLVNKGDAPNATKNFISWLDNEANTNTGVKS